MINRCLFIFFILICTGSAYGKGHNCKLIEKLITYDHVANMFYSSSRDSFIFVDTTNFFSSECNGFYNGKYYKFESTHSSNVFEKKIIIRVSVIDKKSFVIGFSEGNSSLFNYYFKKRGKGEFEIVKLKSYDL